MAQFRIWRDPAARAAFDWKAGPQPGFYRIFYVRGGPEIGAEIRHAPPNDPVTGEPLDRAWAWSVFVDGELLEPPAYRASEAAVAIACWGAAISKEMYDFLVAERAWVRRNAPRSAEADPTRKIDLGKEPIVF